MFFANALFKFDTRAYTRFWQCGNYAFIESASSHKLEYLHQIETDNKFSRYTNTECEAIQREINLIRTSIAEQQHPPMQ